MQSPPKPWEQGNGTPSGNPLGHPPSIISTPGIITGPSSQYSIGSIGPPVDGGSSSSSTTATVVPVHHYTSTTSNSALPFVSPSVPSSYYPSSSLSLPYPHTLPNTLISSNAYSSGYGGTLSAPLLNDPNIINTNNNNNLLYGSNNPALPGWSTVTPSSSPFTTTQPPLLPSSVYPYTTPTSSSMYPSTYPSSYLSSPYYGNALPSSYYPPSPFVTSLQNLQYIIQNMGSLFDSLGMNVTTFTHTLTSAATLLQIIGQTTGEFIGLIRNPHPIDPRIRKYQFTRLMIGSGTVMALYYVLRILLRGRRGGGGGGGGGGGTGGLTSLAIVPNERRGRNGSPMMHRLQMLVFILGGWIGGYQFAQRYRSRTFEEPGVEEGHGRERRETSSGNRNTSNIAVTPVVSSRSIRFTDTNNRISSGSATEEKGNE